MSQMGGEAIDDGNDDGISLIEGTDWTLEETGSDTSRSSNDHVNVQGNGINSTNALLEVP
jgi:hypothetical protein